VGKEGQRDTKKEEAKGVRGRSGQRRIFDRSVVAVLGLGALAIIVLSLKRRATEDTNREAHDATATERTARFREALEGHTQHDTGSSERVNGTPGSGIESTHQEGATFQERELVERAQEITRGSARSSEKSEETAKTSETEQEVRRYLEEVEYPASKDDLVSAARSNDVPEEFIKGLVALAIREYSDPEDVMMALDSHRGSGA
jgi:hypothetical protein